MTLYIDCAILSGFILNYLCLSTAASVLDISIRKRRLIPTAFIMSCATLLSLFGIYFRILLMLMYVPVIRFIFGKCRGVELVRRIGVCICSTLLYCAVIFATVPPEQLYFLNSAGGVFYVAEDMYFYIPLAGVYIAVKTIMFLTTRRKKIFAVRLTIDGKTHHTTAMLDTGNGLRHPTNGTPVIIAERDMFQEVNTQPQIIPYKNIAKGRHYTQIYPVEELCLTEEHKEYKNIYAVLVDKPISSKGDYRVLLHNSFAN